jgi:hypothetical protein
VVLLGMVTRNCRSPLESQESIRGLRECLARLMPSRDKQLHLQDEAKASICSKNLRILQSVVNTEGAGYFSGGNCLVQDLVRVLASVPHTTAWLPAMLVAADMLQTLLVDPRCAESFRNAILPSALGESMSCTVRISLAYHKLRACM